MEINEVFGLDVSGDYAHFRKGFTTSSPISYGVPPRTAISGLLGALFGLPRKGEKSYPKIFSSNNSRITVIPKKPLKKQRINLNLTKVKGETKKLTNLQGPPEEIERNQVPFEMIRNPEYRIYFTINNSYGLDLDEKLKMLERHKCDYTPYLGLSELIADFNYIGRKEVEEKKGENYVDSIINKRNHNPVFEVGKKYQRENMPLVMNEDRVVQEYSDIVYISRLIKKGKERKIQLRDSKIFEVKDVGENIVFFLS